MTDQIRQFLVHLNKPTKLALSVAVDLCIVPLALWLAFFFRLGFERMIDPAAYGWLFLAAIATAIPVFVIAGLYSAILRYMDRDTIVRLFTAVSVAALLLALVIYWARSDLLIPRTVVANYWLLLFGGIGGIRFVARAFLLPGQRHPRLASLLHPRTQSEGIRRVAIYGAGSAGVQLYRNIEHEPDLLPVAFIDDDPSLRRRLIGGMRIVSREDIGTLIKKMGLQEVFLAMPSLEPAERQRILEHLEPLPVHVRTVPSLFDLTTGKKGLQELQEVRVEDMLGREVVHPAPELMARCITNKTVMVTGGGGSIGAELCRQILELNPKQLIVFEHSEFNLFSIEDELRGEIQARELPTDLVGILGSVLNSKQLSGAIQSFGVETIYHCAAYKHVSIVERNVVAGMRNNAFGTLHAANAAIIGGVDNFVLISTDKAVRPTSFMGASKRLAEMMLQSLAAEPRPDFDSLDGLDKLPEHRAHNTRFTVVRFGNVLASSGSVIPIFRNQIEAGGPVTVTHPDATRFFMTMTEASQLVIQASSMGTGGDVFLLDMGEPVKIVELAKRMVRLAGQTPTTDSPAEGEIQLNFIGLRPGEKLHETLLRDQTASPTGHPKISRVQELSLPWRELISVLVNLQHAMDANDLEAIRELLITHLQDYEPDSEIVDNTFESRAARATASIVTLPTKGPR